MSDCGCVRVRGVRDPRSKSGWLRVRPSGRELDVLELIATGHSNDQIAVVLGVRPLTVKRHVANLLAALGACDRAHAVALGFRTGLLS